MNSKASSWLDESAAPEDPDDLEAELFDPIT